MKLIMEHILEFMGLLFLFMDQFVKTCLCRVTKWYNFGTILALFFKGGYNHVTILISVCLSRSYFDCSVSSSLHSVALRSRKY